MNAGTNYTKARAQAQANADRSQSPRWLHQYLGSWWISATPTAGAERINTRAAKARHHATKKSPAQFDREIAEVLAKRSPRGKASPLKKSSAKRVSHATKKASTRDKNSDKITIDQLAEMFGLPDWDKIDEMNQQHYWEMTRGADDQEEAEQAAQTEVYNQWYDAVEAAAEKLFDEHGLELKPTGKQGTSTRRYDFKIVPSASWSDAADKIRDTLNGVGDFHFGSLREFLESGPYTPRQAVLSHLGYVKRRPDVYGSPGARRLYEQHWR